LSKEEEEEKGGNGRRRRQRERSEILAINYHDTETVCSFKYLRNVNNHTIKNIRNRSYNSSC
jgi:hypothetical protein